VARALKFVAIYRALLKYVAMYRALLKYVAIYRALLKYVAIYRALLTYVAIHRALLTYVATDWSAPIRTCCVCLLFSIRTCVIILQKPPAENTTLSCLISGYEVATIRRRLKITGLFCKRAL